MLPLKRIGKNSLILFILIFFTTNCIAQAQSGFVKIKGGELFYRIFGEGPPLVILNGGPGLASDGYEHIAEELSAIRKVILFDQRGTGKSKVKLINEQSITIHNMVNDLERLRKHLKIEKWDVLGQSFGGLYAMAYASRHHQYINKMILSSSAGIDTRQLDSMQDFDFPLMEDMTKEERAVLLQLKEEVNSKNPSEVKMKRYRSGLLARYYINKVESLPKAVEWFAYKSNPAPGISTYVWRSLFTFNYKRRLKKIMTPVLILHGVADFIQINVPMKTHEILQNSRLEFLDESGHMLWLDQPKKVKSLIYAFLQN
ncbi:MAG: alpha/beta hydrolase [Bacteroidota bacterium]